MTFRTGKGNNTKQENYPFTFTQEEGSGYLVEFPDIPGCYANGETPEEPIIAAEDALTSWLKTAEEFGDFIPMPAKGIFSGQWRLRMPRSLHAELVYRAKYEGMSLNTLVTTLLAEAMRKLQHVKTSTRTKSKQ